MNKHLNLEFLSWKIKEHKQISFRHYLALPSLPFFWSFMLWTYLQVKWPLPHTENCLLCLLDLNTKELRKNTILTSPCFSKNSLLCRCNVSIALVKIWGDLSLTERYANDLEKSHTHSRLFSSIHTRRLSSFSFWNTSSKFKFFCKQLL